VSPARSLTAALLAAVLGQSAPTGGPSTIAPPGSPEVASALGQLAARLARQVAEASPEGPIGLYARADSAELARGFITLLVAELSKAKLGAIAVSAASPDAAEGVARDRGARSLARVSLSLDRGQLEARGDLLSTWVNFWSGKSPTRAPRPAAILQASVSADAQALALASSSIGVGSQSAGGALNLLGATLVALPLPPAAIAAGDLDGDGKDEIAALTNDELIVFSAEGRVLARRDHRSLPPSPTPCREPFGAVAIYGNPRRIAYFSANRARGEVLAFDLARSSLRPIEPLDRVPLSRGVWGTFTPGQNTFDSEIYFDQKRDRYADHPFSALSFSDGPLSSRDSRSDAAADGGGSLQSVIVFPNGSGLWKNAASRQNDSWRLSGLGAATALVDIDGNRLPDLVTTTALYNPERDELRVLQGGPIEPATRWRGPIPRGRALQMVAASNGMGNPQHVVLGVWLPDGSGELQVFRKVSP